MLRKKKKIQGEEIELLFNISITEEYFCSFCVRLFISSWHIHIWYYYKKKKEEKMKEFEFLCSLFFVPLFSLWFVLCSFRQTRNYLILNKKDMTRIVTLLEFWIIEVMIVVKEVVADFRALSKQLTISEHLLSIFCLLDEKSH